MQRRFLFALSALAFVSGAVLAQGYPNKAIKLQVPFAPGGTSSIVARTIAPDELSTLQQPAAG